MESVSTARERYKRASVGHEAGTENGERYRACQYIIMYDTEGQYGTQNGTGGVSTERSMIWRVSVRYGERYGGCPYGKEYGTGVSASFLGRCSHRQGLALVPDALHFEGLYSDMKSLIPDLQNDTAVDVIRFWLGGSGLENMDALQTFNKTYMDYISKLYDKWSAGHPAQEFFETMIVSFDFLFNFCIS